MAREDSPQRGGNDEGVDSQDAQIILTDYFSLQKSSAMRATRERETEGAATECCSDNREFWDEAGHFAEGQHILLSSFHVTEWMPASPGRYLTASARMEREKAKQFWAGDEYLPLGKFGMILGGIGTVRLASKRTKFGVLHFLSATSSGDSNQGVPMCMPPEVHRQIVDSIKDYGGVVCDIAGTIQVLDRSIDRITFDRGIPRYVVLVDDVRVIRPSRPGSVRATASVLYGGACREYERHYRSDRALGWSFAYFDPATDSSNGLPSAVDWLEDYARRHSVSEGPRILGDFDEHMEHFQLPVAMPLSSLLAGKADLEDFAAVARKVLSAARSTPNARGAATPQNRGAARCSALRRGAFFRRRGSGARTQNCRIAPNRGC